MDLAVEHWLRPRDLAEALAMLAERPAAVPVAGGTDLVVQLRDGRRRADMVLDLSPLDLRGVRRRRGGLEIGAATTMAAIARDPEVRRDYPGLAAAAAQVGAWPIQCRATLAGNLANASPAADTAPPLLVAGAVLEVASARGDRLLPLRDFFLGPGRCALEPGELIVAVFLPPVPAGVVERFTKVGPRREQAISMVSLAARARAEADGRLGCIRLALGSVAPTPVRARATERLLEGRRPDAATRREAALVLQSDIAPIDDLRAPARYRRIAAAVLLDRFLEALDG